MRCFRAVCCSALFLFCFVGGALAQDVTLKSRDGLVALSGNLLGFDGEFYRVDSDYGVLMLDGSGVLCEGPGCPNLDDFVAELRISGAATIGNVLMPALVEGFGLRFGYSLQREEAASDTVVYTLTENPQNRVAGRFTIVSSNTDAGFDALLNEGTDLVMALREIRPDELRAAGAAGLGDLRHKGRSRVLALDALVPIVAPGNPVRSIAIPDLARVLSGEVDNWTQLGGPDAPIAVHVRVTTSGLGQAAEDSLLSPIGATLSPQAVQHDSDAALLEAVLADPFAIGLSSSSAVGTAVSLSLGGACGVTLQATPRNAKTEDYPLTAPVFLYQPALRLPKLAREFLSYTRSAQAQYVIRRAGFVDQLPEEVPIDAQGDRFANAIAHAGAAVPLQELQRMTARLSGMKRLTTSFRFQTGSADLDAQSQSNVALMARALESGQYDGRDVIFIGFSDGEIGVEQSGESAAERAETVRRAVLAAAQTIDLDRIDLKTDAFGEAMPIACDDSTWGRDVNRRVEVWVR
jgi:phosphate transport system substrate-binding protein